MLSHWKSVNSFDIFFFRHHTVPYHCASIIAAFFLTQNGWNRKYPISPQIVCKRQFRSIKPDDTSAKAASASQDMSINEVSQTVYGNTSAADYDNATVASAAAPAAVADAAAAATDDTAPAANATPLPSPGSEVKAAKAIKAVATVAATVRQRYLAGRCEGGGQAPKSMILFVLDLVYHATATNVPLSCRPAECKMCSFQAAQPAQPGLGCIGITWDIQRYVEMSVDILIYTDIGNLTS
jgi:hypothetical protein